MDKGIFYLLCSFVIVAAVALSTVAVTRQVTTSCVGKTVVQEKTVMVSPSPIVTATPAAMLRRVVTVAPVKK